MTDNKEKAKKLADRMNKITEAFSSKLEDANDLIVSSDELIDESKNFIETYEQETFDVSEIPQIINLQNMIEDIQYVRKTLKDTTEIGNNLMQSISAELEIEPNPKLLESYAQLSATITENMRLFLQCYKDISTVLLNLYKTQDRTPKTVTNINIEADGKIETRSTSELIKELGNLNS